MSRMGLWTEADVLAAMCRDGKRRQEPPPSQETPEGTLLEQVRALAKRYGWESYHTHDSRKSEPGFPDIALCDGHTLLLYELKTNTGKVTEAQARWLSLLAHSERMESGLWRPKDMPQILHTLSRGKA